MDKLASLLTTQSQKMTVSAGSYTQRASQLCAPNCPECGGAGWVRYDAPFDHPLFGKVFPCPNAALDHPYYDKFGLGARERISLAWESIWDEDNALEGVKAVQETLARGSGMVFLWGDNGKAKTLMLKVAVAEMLRSEKGGAHYANMADVIDDLRTCYDEPNPGKAMAERVAYWSVLHILALDEFDFIRNTEFAAERQFIILDRRYEAAMNGENLITLMASNSAPETLPKRLYDRIRDGRNQIIHLEGESMRPGLEW